MARTGLQWLGSLPFPESEGRASSLGPDLINTVSQNICFLPSVVTYAKKCLFATTVLRINRFGMHELGQVPIWHMKLYGVIKNVNSEICS